VGVDANRDTPPSGADGVVNAISLYVEHGRDTFHSVHVETAAKIARTARRAGIKNDCSICSLKPKCTTAVVRKVTRDVHEDLRDQVRALANTEAFQQSHRERKKIEMRFAHMKRIFRLDRLRLRGLTGARDEVLLTATAQNLRRLVKFLCRPPPLAAACPA
jgi:hypothetical protein